MIADEELVGELWAVREGWGDVVARGEGRTDLNCSSCCAGYDTAEGGWLLLSLGLDLVF